MYSKLINHIEGSPYPDFRLVLSEIIGDYLFRCPNQYFAKLFSDLGCDVYLYEFTLPTRTPGFPCCDGISCHTCELPYVFNQMGVILSDYSYYQGPGKNLHKQGKKLSEYPDVFGAKKDVSLSYTSTDHIDEEVSKLISGLWVSFASSGNPNHHCDNIPSERFVPPVYWPPINGGLPKSAIGSDSKFSRATVGEISSYFESGSIDKHGRRKYSSFSLNSLSLRNKNFDKMASLVTPDSGAKSIHQFIFSEESFVSLLEDDCICRMWDELDYRF